MRRLRHWKDVFKRAFIAAGWVAGIVTVVVGGSVLAAGGFLLHERHRVIAVVLLASGFVAALLEGSYRVWDATETDLRATRARVGELDTATAKRAYVDMRIQEARDLIGEVAALGTDWYGESARVLEDLSHWERGVRAEIRSAWGPEQARRFDRHTGTEEPDYYRNRDPASEVQSYIERRIRRLVELRDEIG